MSTFVEVFRFEVSYRVRQWSTWLYFAAAAFLTWSLLVDLLIGEAQSSGTLHANSPSLIATSTVIGTMLLLAATAGLFGDAAARDLESRIHPLLYSSPLSKSGYLFGRFAGAFAVNALLLGMTAAGLLLIETMRDGQAELFGPFRPFAYVQPYLLFSLPTLFATGAIMFALSALTGRTFASYAAGTFLFFGSMLAEELFAEHMNRGLLGVLADPFAFTALSELGEYWTPFDKNTRYIPFAGALFWNRVTWLAVGAGMLALTRWRFGFGDGERQRRRQERRRAKVERAVLQQQTAPMVVPDVPRGFGPTTRLRQIGVVTARSLADVFMTRSAMAIVALFLGMVIAAGWESAGLILDTPTWPMTYLVAHDVLGDAGVLLLLLTAIVAGELVWRERDARTSEIADAAPLPNWVSLTGKLGALVVALAFMQGLLMGIGVLLQALEGYYEFEPALYVKILFGIQLPHYVLWAAFAIFAHTIVNQKYAGHLVIALFWAFCRFGRERFGLEHNLLAYSADPGWSYSDLSGFEPFLGAWASFQLYWAAWALLLLVVANLFWIRGRDTRFRERLRSARLRFTRPAAAAMSFAVAAVLATGGWVFYNTNVLNDYSSTDERYDRRAEYERLYKRYEKLPQPLITRARLHIDLRPERRAVDIRGTYQLQNQSATAIETVHVLLDRDERSLAFDPPARRLSNDTRLRYQIYRLERPLQPGASMQLRFHVASEPRGFTNARAGAELVANGTYFDRKWLPMIGYQPEFELTDDKARKERGLAPRERLPAMTDREALQTPSAIRDARWLHLETVIGTTPEQIAVAPGSLRRTWTANGRRWFHYQTDAPIQNNYAFHSAAYAVREEQWNGVRIQVLHHPRHTFNLDRMMRAIKATLDYQTRNFGPYPHRELRVVEFPRHRGTYARAYPTAIAFSEGFGFMAKPENGIDYPFLVAAHEVSHQWWGNQLRPARVEGGPVLAESMAHYGAAMVMEKEHGREPVDRFRRLLMHEYLVGRQNRRTTEVPLLRSNDQKYIHYEKGALVLYALRDYIGEEKVNLALRRVFERHRFGAPPYPTTRELYGELQAVTPAPLHGLLRDFFEEITLWELQAKHARVARQPDGSYRVTFTVSAQKVKADAIGRDRRVPMNDPVEVGVFAGAMHDGEPGEPLYLAKHPIRSGEQTLTITVPRAPSRVGIDPYQKLIERDLSEHARENNFAEIAAVQK